MNNTDAVPSYETKEIGTPLDYTSDMYRVYFEIRDHDGMAKEIISGFLGPARAEKIVTLAHGYEMELPIQCIPEIIRLLATENIAIYQVVRYAKTNNSWG